MSLFDLLYGEQGLPAGINLPRLNVTRSQYAAEASAVISSDDEIIANLISIGHDLCSGSSRMVVGPKSECGEFRQLSERYAYSVENLPTPTKPHLRQLTTTRSNVGCLAVPSQVRPFNCESEIGSCPIYLYTRWRSQFEQSLILQVTSS